MEKLQQRVIAILFIILLIVSSISSFYGYSVIIKSELLLVVLLLVYCGVCIVVLRNIYMNPKRINLYYFLIYIVILINIRRNMLIIPLFIFFIFTKKNNLFIKIISKVLLVVLTVVLLMTQYTNETYSVIDSPSGEYRVVITDIDQGALGVDFIVELEKDINEIFNIRCLISGTNSPYIYWINDYTFNMNGKNIHVHEHFLKRSYDR